MTSSFTGTQKLTLNAINVAVSALSLVGSLFIVVNFCAFKRLRSFAFQLIFCMALCDMVNSIGNILGSPDDGSARCLIQAYLISLGELGSLFWTAAIAFTIHQIYLYRNLEVDKKLPWFHLVVWGCTLILAVLPQFTNSYGRAGEWCWIERGTASGDVYRYVSFYVPLWLLIIYMLFVYVRIALVERRHRRGREAMGASTGYETRSARKGVMTRIMYYPFILIFAYVFATMNRIYQQASDNDTLFWLTVLHVFFRSIKGLLNAVAYGLTESVIRENRRVALSVLHRFGCCLGSAQQLTDKPTDHESSKSPLSQTHNQGSSSHDHRNGNSLATVVVEDSREAGASRNGHRSSASSGEEFSEVELGDSPATTPSTHHLDGHLSPGAAQRRTTMPRTRGPRRGGGSAGVVHARHEQRNQQNQTPPQPQGAGNVRPDGRVSANSIGEDNRVRAHSGADDTDDDLDDLSDENRSDVIITS